MQKPDKAPEPSMEEILASIRKIIAEEPIGSRPEPEPRSPALGGPSSQPGSAKPADFSDPPRFALPSRDERGSDGPPIGVDDALADLMDDPPLPRFTMVPGREEPAPKFPSRSTAAPEDDNQRPSWLFARPAGASAQPASPSAAESNRGAGLLGQLESIRSLPQSGGAGGEGLAPKPAGPQKISAPEPLFDRQREGDRPPSGGGITALPSGQPHDLFRPVGRTSPLDTGASQRADGSAPAGTGGNRSEPAQPQPTMRAAEPVRGTAPAPVAEAKPQPVEPAGAAAERQSRPRAEGASAEKPAPAPVAGRSPPAEASPSAILGQGLASPTPGSNSEAGRAGPDTAAKQDAPAVGAAVRTLEDTVAELLRPMLRDWLDANMPRIVEKALRVELASSAKRPGSAD